MTGQTEVYMRPLKMIRVVLFKCVFFELRMARMF